MRMSKRLKIIVISLLVIAGISLSFSAGCIIGFRTPATTDRHLNIVTEAWDIIFQEYVDQSKLDATKLSQGAVKGMIEALDDPYTAYLDPQTYELFISSLHGSFEGIGAQIGVKDGQVMIIAPLPDSPAAKAGIKAGDIILEVDGLSIGGMSTEEAVLHIRGPKGTTVSLLILHQGESNPMLIEIVRAEIKTVSVNLEMKGDIACIRIIEFSERTNGELSAILQSNDFKSAKGVIIDLRANPGGFLDAAVDVASYFIKEGVIVSVVDNHGNKTYRSVSSQEVTVDLPMVILTDNYSASSSEVLAGAMQDYGRAVIAGTKTWGKGSVNTLYQLDDGSVIYITIARWLTPKGRAIEGKGIEPDYELDLEGDALIQWAIDYLEGKR
jgi:carboxyl-terminal processing protease